MVNSKFEKNCKKIKKIWNFVGSKILKGARRVQILAQFGHSSSSCQTKNFKMYSVSSKFKKLARKFKKIWNFLASKRLGCAWCVQFFFAFRHCRSSRRKNKIWRRKKLWKNALFCFFARAPRMPFDHKNLQAPCAPKPLWCQKKSYF